MNTMSRSTERIEASILKECDEGESFCSMLAFWLQDKAHWRSNPFASDLMNQVSDLIDDTRAEVEKSRNSATQDAHDTAGDHRRSAA